MPPFWHEQADAGRRIEVFEGKTLSRAVRLEYRSLTEDWQKSMKPHTKIVWIVLPGLQLHESDCSVADGSTLL
jgi:hypothetical protein